MAPQTKAIIYAAKSTEDRRGSIATQLEDGRRMAEREGWEIVGEYQDEAASAWSGNRGPGLDDAKRVAAEVAAERGACVLVAQHSDRIARGAGNAPDASDHLVEVVAALRRSGVELRTVQDDFFGDHRIGLVMAAMMGQRNTEDSSRKSLAVQAGMKRGAEAGRGPGGTPPYGYEYVKGERRGRLRVVPARATVVSRIYSEFDGGRPIAKIARDLDAERVPTSRGGRWRNSTLNRILSNQAYRGLAKHRGETFPGQHPAIVDDDLWARVQQRLAINPKRTGRPTRGPHLFRGGMLRCGGCGEAMIARSFDRQPDIYYCNGAHQFQDCSMPTQRRKHIDDAVYRYFEQVGLDVEATRALLAEARDRKLAEVAALREEAEREVRSSEASLARIRADYKAGDLPPEDWAEFKDELTEEVAGARAEADRLREQEAMVRNGSEFTDADDETVRMLDAIRAAIAGEIRNAEALDGVRAVLDRLFENFIVHRSTPAQVHVELIGETWIEPVVREQAVEGYTETLRPVLRREPLTSAASNEHIGSPLR